MHGTATGITAPRSTAGSPASRPTFNFNLPPGVIIPPPGLNIDHSASVTPNDYLSDLQFAIMLAGEARKGNGAIFADFIYLDLSGLQSKVRHVTTPGGDVTLPVNADVNTGLRVDPLHALAGSYTIDRTRLGNFDLLGGFRYATLKTSLDWNFAGPNGILSQSGGVSDNLNLYDGIVGFKGAVVALPGRQVVPAVLRRHRRRQ